MKLIYSLLFCLFCSGFVAGQADKQSLIKESEEKLKSGQASVSQILTDKKYDAVHPETSFRELIKKYCRAETLAIVTDTIPGRKIKVAAMVKNEDGKPVADALVYLYQTDARGWYAADAPHILAYEGDHRHARLFGYVKTNKEGRFELHTIKPSGYPKSDLPAHIHVHVTADGYQPYGTEFLFDDDERLTDKIRENAIRDRFLISKPEKTNPPFEQQFSYELKIRKR